MMSIIKINDYIFSVNIEKTKKYYITHTLCDCYECSNYYIQIKDEFPKLNNFLSEFGVDISKPDEIISNDMGTYIDYHVVNYTVCGTINAIGQHDICIYDALPLNVIIGDGYVSPNEKTEQYFIISVTKIQLPYVIDEISNV